MTKHTADEDTTEDKEDIDNLEELLSVKIIFGIVFIFILTIFLTIFDTLRSVFNKLRSVFDALCKILPGRLCKKSTDKE